MLSILASTLDLSVETIELFALVLVRVSTLIFVLPILNVASVVPTTAKVGLSFFLALLVFPQLPPSGIVIANSPIFFFLLVLEQIMVGLMIGFTATYIFHFVNIGGHIIARDIGISMGGSMDPVQDETADEITVLLLLIFVIAFLVKGFHHYFIMVVFDSFQYIPLGHYSWNMLPIAQTLCLLSAGAFITGIKLAAPAMIALLLTTLGMALMSRVMPQMNVWIVAVPLKVLVGVFILWQTFPLMVSLFDDNFKQVLEALQYLMKSGVASG